MNIVSTYEVNEPLNEPYVFIDIPCDNWRHEKGEYCICCLDSGFYTKKVALRSIVYRDTLKEGSLFARV